jgi:molybdopterin molybdotransferase
MLTVAEAQARIVAATPALSSRPVDLTEATGLVLAEDVFAKRDLPPFDNSAMDGFAVRSADTKGASTETPARLRIIGEVAAGFVFDGSAEPGTAVRIMTGAPIPRGVDAVIEVEETAVDGETLLARMAVDSGRSFRLKGSDIARGTMALRAGTVLGPAQIALLAALGEARPNCVSRPRVAVLATGDELVNFTEEPGPGQIADTSSPSLWAAVASVGADAMHVPRARDNRADLERALQEAASADLIVSVGGVSMGEYDLVRDVVRATGQVDFWKVAIRPGKPLAFGEFHGKPLIGLPGNPVSSLVGFEVFVLPAIMSMSGRPLMRRPSVKVEMATPMTAPGGLRTFARVTLERRDGKPPLAHPSAHQASFQLAALATSNALLDIAEETTELRAGDSATALLIDQPPAPPL